MPTLLQDLKYGVRMLAKSPGVTAVAVLTLALGIGANTAIFTVVNALLLRGLAVRNPDQLVSLAFSQRGASQVGTLENSISVFSYPDLKDVSEQAASLMHVFAYRFGVDGLSEGGHADRIITNYVTGNYFSVLGVKPALGRLVLPSEGKPSRTDPILVLGYSYWKNRFGGDPSIIGKQVRLDGHLVTVVGVASRDFHGALNEVDIQAFLPLNMERIEFATQLDSRAARSIFALARLKSGTTPAQAQNALNVIADRLSQQYPKTDARASIQVYPQSDAALTPMPQPGMHQKELLVMSLFLALAGVVLLLACINVANILLVRATAREHEMAIRSALGAPRHLLLRQLLTESLLLALIGCAAGVLVGVWASASLSSIHVSVGLPVNLNFTLDWAVFAYALAAALLAGIVVGIVPALRAACANPGDALHETGRTSSVRQHHLRNTLVVAQVAGSIVLLTVAGLFTQSVVKARRMDLGFNPDHLSNFHLDPHEIGYNDDQGRLFYKRLLERIRALPGVQSATLAFTYPSNGVYMNADAVYVEGHLPPKDQPAPVISVNDVTPGYFKTVGIPIIAGRAFADTDTSNAQPVAVINQTMAKEFWPGEDPVGREFRRGNESSKPIKVVGIARDSKYEDLFENSEPYLYQPLAQDYVPIQTLQVRSLVPTATLDREVEQQIHDLAPGLPIFDVQTMRQALDGGGFYTFRVGAYMAAALGLLGLLLASVGVYGVISFSTSQRTREIGIRMALGARPEDIWQAIFRQGLTIVVAGAGFGIMAALGLTRLMAHLLYGVSAHDPVTYLSVVFLIAAITLLACYIPARRATKVDPMVALRYE
jgi:macrolide transport system ATP-binding/permease protein